jgi:aspartate beta-hydroxylase
MSPLYDHAANIIRRIYDSRLAGPPILELERHFPAGRDFITAWQRIRDEAQQLAGQLDRVPRFHEIMHEQTAISANDQRDWRMFILKAYGEEIPRNMARCPTLAALVTSSPDVLSASLSFLSSKKYIPPHRGPFRGVLRFYLALSMPKLPEGTPASVLKIANSEYRLSDGDWLLWDDTYRHEAWNDSDEVRMVLLLDVWRRGMPFDMRIFSRLLISIVRMGVWVRGVPA